MLQRTGKGMSLKSVIDCTNKKISFMQTHGKNLEVLRNTIH